MIGSRPSQALVLSALFLVQVLFGLNYIFSKIIVENIQPMIWAAVRIIISTFLMVIVAIAMKRPVPKDFRGFYLPLVGFALIGVIINQGLFLVGLSYTTATNSAILSTLIPVFTLFFVTLLGKEPLTVARFFGFMCAFAGVLVLRHIENYHFSDETFKGDLFIILNCASFGLYLALSKKFLETHDRFWTTAVLFFYGSIGMSIIAMFDASHFSPPLWSPILVFSIVFAIVGGTLITYFLNNWALAFASPTQVAIFVYIQPVIAALLSYFMFNEKITTRTIGSSALIFAGVLLAVKNPRRRE